MKAAAKGGNVNEKYYEEMDDSSNNRNDEQDPYDINQRHGYESSSTAPREISNAANRLKKKLNQIAKDEVVSQGDKVQT